MPTRVGTRAGLDVFEIDAELAFGLFEAAVGGVVE